MDTKSSWQSAISGFPHGLRLGLILFNDFINDLSDWMECILSKFTDDTKLGGNIHTLKGSSIFQKGLSRLEKWADRDFIKFKGNCQVLHQGRNRSMQQ